MFSEKDLLQFKNKGISAETVNLQIANFKSGFPYINLFAAATKEYGLKVLNEEEEHDLLEAYEELMGEKDVVKFVPASGAASRMFKHLFEFFESYENNEEGHALFNKEQSFNSVYYFFQNIEKFAFYQDLKSVLAANKLDLLREIENKNYGLVLDYLLHEKGLGYAALPKGLLKFHHYEDGSRYAIEEHLVESAVYGKDKENISKLHFTVSPEHQSKFESAVAKVKHKYEDIYHTTFEIDFSQQKPSTDTIAVTLDNEPFREDDGSILFRPGGHGALIENLNDIDADIIFVKNIDNIVPDRIKDTTFKYKKLIGAYLIETQQQIHDYLELLDAGNLDDDQANEIFCFVEEELFMDVPVFIKAAERMEQIDWLFENLNRPVRVCGMVKNEGEPGGGPFVVLDEDDRKSLQIVESSQIDFSKQDQADIVKKATHFNPVDLVCAVKDFKGQKIDLKQFVDPKTGFVSEKSKNGKSLKAQELPGLWNGAMADWITIFMEVPILTFNPVKTVNDLLREQHQ
jgi:hypothetical protein